MGDQDDVFRRVRPLLLIEKLGNAQARFLASFSFREAEICRSQMECFPDIGVFPRDSSHRKSRYRSHLAAHQ
jgi:hypothetical protein